MKKLLAVILAVITLCSVIGVGATAVNYNDFIENDIIDPTSQVILVFDLNGGSLKNASRVYNTETGKFEYLDGAKITGQYIMLPLDKSTQNVGQYIQLPYVTPPAGSDFKGWFCYDDGVTHAGGADYKIPAGKAGNVIQFYASYIPAEAEEDTLGSILGILIKVFGAIAGLLLYNGDTEKGIALFDKVLGALDF